MKPNLSTYIFYNQMLYLVCVILPLENGMCPRRQFPKILASEVCRQVVQEDPKNVRE